MRKKQKIVDNIPFISTEERHFFQARFQKQPTVINPQSSNGTLFKVWLYCEAV
jgi:hypothetical protein